MGPSNQTWSIPGTTSAKLRTPAATAAAPGGSRREDAHAVGSYAAQVPRRKTKCSTRMMAAKAAAQ
jgi:hypothetical protein